MRLLMGLANQAVLLDTCNPSRLALPPVGSQVSVRFPREACLVME